MKNEILVNIDNVSFRYHDQLILEKINLKIKKGSFLGLIGPNGSGKTTLLKIILGLLKPTTGSIHLFGQENKSFNDWSKIGYVPQKPGSFVMRFPITVHEVVAMGLTTKRKWFDFVSNEYNKVIKEALNAVGMDRYGSRLISDLSGGQQQRVFIARALVTEPELLILDEPTLGVDVDSQTKFYQLLRKLNEKKRITLILVSHDLNVVAREVNEIACINSRLVCHGSPKEVLKSNFMDGLYGKDLRFIVHGH